MADTVDDRPAFPGPGNHGRATQVPRTWRPGMTGTCHQVRQDPGAGGYPPQLSVPGQGGVASPGLPAGAGARPDRRGVLVYVQYFFGRGSADGGNHGRLDALSRVGRPGMAAAPGNGQPAVRPPRSACRASLRLSLRDRPRASGGRRQMVLPPMRLKLRDMDDGRTRARGVRGAAFLVAAHDREAADLDVDGVGQVEGRAAHDREHVQGEAVGVDFGVTQVDLVPAHDRDHVDHRGGPEPSPPVRAAHDRDEPPGRLARRRGRGGGRLADRRSLAEAPAGRVSPPPGRLWSSPPGPGRTFLMLVQRQPSGRRVLAEHLSVLSGPGPKRVALLLAPGAVRVRSRASLRQGQSGRMNGQVPTRLACRPPAGKLPRHPPGT